MRESRLCVGGGACNLRQYESDITQLALPLFVIVCALSRQKTWKSQERIMGKIEVEKHRVRRMYVPEESTNACTCSTQCRVQSHVFHTMPRAERIEVEKHRGMHARVPHDAACRVQGLEAQAQRLMCDAVSGLPCLASLCTNWDILSWVVEGSVPAFQVRLQEMYAHMCVPAWVVVEARL